MADPPAEEPSVVHILLFGRAFCGQEGLPCDWPAGHRWVSAVHDPDISKATCEECKARHQESKYA